MRSPVLACLAAACAAFVLLTGAGATAPSALGMPTLTRHVPAPLVGQKAPAGSRGQAERRREEGTLLDEVGRLVRRVEPSEVSAWKRELRDKLTLERRALLHLWLGEYKLAHSEDPVGAYWHFRTINRMGASPPAPLHPTKRRTKAEAAARDGEGSFRARAEVLERASPPAPLHSTGRRTRAAATADDGEGSFRSQPKSAEPAGPTAAAVSPELARLKGRAVLNIAIGRFQAGSV